MISNKWSNHDRLQNLVCLSISSLVINAGAREFRAHQAASQNNIFFVLENIVKSESTCTRRHIHLILQSNAWQMHASNTSQLESWIYSSEFKSRTTRFFVVASKINYVDKENPNEECFHRGYKNSIIVADKQMPKIVKILKKSLDFFSTLVFASEFSNRSIVRERFQSDRLFQFAVWNFQYQTFITWWQRWWDHEG